MASLWAKIKGLNLKNVIKAFSLVWGLVLIIVMTITTVGFKQDFNILDWLGKSLILLGIMVFGLLMGESIGGDKQREKVGGLYQTNLKNYNEYRNSIDSVICYFVNWFQWFMPQELRDKKINYLIMNNVPETKAKNIVDYCTIDDLYDLKTHPIEKENGKVVIRKLNEFEIEPVERVLNGGIKLLASNPNYFLTAFSRSTSKSVLEVGKQLDKDIKYNKVSSRALKITSSLIISLALGILTVNDFMGGGDAQAQMNAWVNLISRITALITSLFSGWLSSVVDIKLKAEKIANKTNVLKLFKNAYDKKMFVYKSEDELAKEEMEKYKKNIVVPEIVNKETILEIENKE